MIYLIVEDNEELCALLQRGLETPETQVLVATNGERALELIGKRFFDVIVLDVNLPQKNGFEIAREIRSRDIRTPILFLTSQTSLKDKISGFDSGGDDYLVKPFELMELKVRLQSLIRRNANGAGSVEVPFDFENLKIDLRAQKVYVENEHVILSPREFALLLLFANHPQTAYSRREILEKIWDGADFIDPNIVDQYVSYLRRKIDRKGFSIIETVRGVGYRLGNITK